MAAVRSAAPVSDEKRIRGVYTRGYAIQIGNLYLYLWGDFSLKSGQVSVPQQLAGLPVRLWPRSSSCFVLPCPCERTPLVHVSAHGWPWPVFMTTIRWLYND